MANSPENVIGELRALLARTGYERLELVAPVRLRMGWCVDNHGEGFRTRQLPGAEPLNAARSAVVDQLAVLLERSGWQRLEIRRTATGFSGLCIERRGTAWRINPSGEPIAVETRPRPLRRLLAWMSRPDRSAA